MNRPRGPVPHLTHPALLKGARSRFGRFLEGLAAAVSMPIAIVGAFAFFLASKSLMAGVTVTTAARSGNGDLLRETGSRYFVVGITERGDTTKAIKVKNMAEFVQEFGNWVSYGFLTDDLQTYFEEGGTEAYVGRVVGPSATKGTKVLVDRAGSPLTTLTLTPIGAGAWSSDMTVAVANGNVANTFNITLVYKTGTVDEITETYKNLTTPADATTQINGRSRLVTCANAGSATVAPNNNPAVLSAAAFSAGTDDRASVTGTILTTALTTLMVPTLGPGACAVPGYDSSLVGANLRAHAKANGRVALTHDVAGASAATNVTSASTFYGASDGEWLAFIAPWVKIPDGAGGTRTVPPTGFAAGKRAAAHQSDGPWRWPAGNAGLANFVVGTELDITRTSGDTMTDGGVSPIRTIVGQGIELYGWRSCSVASAYYSLADRDTLNTLAWQASQALEPYVFDPIDSKGITIGGVKAELQAICEAMRIKGGLYERRDATTNALLDPGYSVNVTANVGTRTITANVAVRVADAAEFINVTITKVASDQGV